MALHIHFETCNAAFGETDQEHRVEVSHLLRALAYQVQRGDGGGIIIDGNGNSIGTWALDRGYHCPIPQPQPVKPAPGRPRKPPVHCSCCGRLVATWTCCDACGCVYCGSCASVPDEGGNDCAEPGCNLYGVSR